MTENGYENKDQARFCKQKWCDIPYILQLYGMSKEMAWTASLLPKGRSYNVLNDGVPIIVACFL